MLVAPPVKPSCAQDPPLKLPRSLCESAKHQKPVVFAELCYDGDEDYAADDVDSMDILTLIKTYF